jgi:succinate dehydrogenase hydrophobic anchor subunit
MEYPILDKIPLFPLIKNFRANNVFNAFILAGLFQTILLSLTFSSRDIVQKYETNEFWKWTISIVYIFIITIISYTVMYLVFGFGGGMLTN